MTRNETGCCATLFGHRAATSKLPFLRQTATARNPAEIGPQRPATTRNNPQSLQAQQCNRPPKSAESCCTSLARLRTPVPACLLRLPDGRYAPRLRATVPQADSTVTEGRQHTTFPRTLGRLSGEIANTFIGQQLLEKWWMDDSGNGLECPSATRASGKTIDDGRNLRRSKLVRRIRCQPNG